MVRSRYGYRTKSIPSITTSKGQSKQISFKDGRNTYADNDDLKVTELAEAIDARFTKIGRYKTRRGLDANSSIVGEAMSAENTATTGASNYVVNGSAAIAQPITATRAECLTSVDVRIRTTTASAGVLLVEVYTNKSGAPGDRIARSTIVAAEISSTYAWKTVRFVNAPSVTASQALWVVLRGQNERVGNYEVSTSTAASSALITPLYPTTGWSTAGYSVNVRINSAPYTPVRGLMRAYRSNGLKQTLLAYGSTVATVNESTGAITSLKSDFLPNATAYRMRMVQDAAYVVNGLAKPWRYTFATSAWDQLTAAPYVPSLIEEHKGLLFFNDVDDKTRIFYSNFAEFDKYTSTDFIYVPAPKSFDALTAFAKLNGVLYLFANRNKFALMGSDNDTFSLDEAASQRGTFTQESCVYDANYIYHADNDGVWQFNGTDEQNLALAFLDEYQAIPNKNTIKLDVFNNRLYIFYASAGSADVNECFVYNLQLKRHESRDLNTYIGATFGRGSQDNLFLQASNRVATVYFAERLTNDYHNLGDVINFELRTAFNHFDQPGSLKRVPKWRPVFASVSGDYSVDAGWAKDMQSQAVYQQVRLTGGGYRFNTGKLFNTGLTFSGTKNVEPTTLIVPGTFKRLQRRYRHVAAHEPVEVDSEIMSLEVQRMI